MNDDKRYAVLIDADNVSAKYIKAITDELSNEGIITYRRIYGDWTKSEMSPWKSVLLNHSITPIQQYSYTSGKNATDSAMIIDAMDILYSGNVDGFCIVSSDSDFTRLASRLRESGMYVIGMGERKTPNPFIAACNRFLYLEVLTGDDSHTKQQSTQYSGDGLTADIIKNAMTTILTEISDDDGWASLSQAGNILTKRFPNFDVRNFGFVKLTPFMKSLGAFEIYSVPSENGNVKVIYIRNK
ncbi:MAG: NYN domain-containing protein [Oscillospiraceae bacterium]|nr:NYN domain-containing protein [Oscillospiraceae bacterium]